MKNTHTNLAERYLILIKIDSENLFERIKEREKIYMEHFSAKRDRNIFDEVFVNRYAQASMFDLAHLPSEVIELANDFYTTVDLLYWYLMHTEDMPNAIEDEVIRNIALIGKKFTVLTLYIDAELSGEISNNKSEDLTKSNDLFIQEDDLNALEDIP